MKMIRYEIPQYLVTNDMRDYIASRPSLTRDEAISEWMTTKYRTWIEGTINPVAEFIANIEPPYFDVTFTNETDGKTFLAMMGGREY